MRAAMGNREEIQPRKYIERKPMCFVPQQAAMFHRQREGEQVPPGSKSVASI